MSNDAEGQDQFKSVIEPHVPTQNHRARYGTVDQRTAWILDWCTRHPDTTLSSGEAWLLMEHIRRLEARIHELEQESR